MNNDVHVVTEWYMNKNHVAELSMVFYNKNNNLIGYIDISASGDMRWQIVDLEYKNYFFNILPYLYVGDIDDRISYESTEPNLLRWTRARIYIANHNLLINYSQEINNLREERKMSR